MLSRAGILAGHNSKSWARQTLRFAASLSGIQPPGENVYVGPQRIIRQEPGKVRMGFIPDEWFTFFYKKTGVTGPYVFATSFITYLVSKEWYVIEHQFSGGVAITLLCIIAVKKLGPSVAKYLDKEIDIYESSLNEGRQQEKDGLVGYITHEKNNQTNFEGQLTLVEAKRENVSLQLEAVYRERLMTVYGEVTKRLQFQLAKQNVERRIAQKHLVDWVLTQVKKSITSEEEKKQIDKCIADLAILVKDPNIK